MTEDRLGRIGDLFEEVAAAPALDRARLLEKLSPDPELRAEVLELLSGADSAFAYFDDLAGDIARGAAGELDAASRVERRFGRWRALREIGRGGMGVVYLAERADGQFEQRVALKLIRRGVESDRVVARFLAERQILARLEHPGIARLLDGGLSDDGRPFLVMEHVAGTPLHHYCDQRRLTIGARLRLLIEVGDAVQYAHRSLVVHRDLKPGNILVDAEGHPKLLDFGIAKLLEAAGDEPADVALALESSSLDQRTATRAMTPPYAAPEQLRGESVTTATDVYALGVVLYELLTGRRPFEFEGKPLAEAERLVLETESPRPATRVDAAAAELRSTSLRRLRRLLSGDLERVVLRALHKDPERRYRSAEQFMEDLGRFLAGLPVVARRDTLAYRARRFARRHAVGVAAASAFVALSLAFGVVMAVQSIRLARERDKAQQVATLLIDLFEVSDPARARGESITAREALDRGFERVASRLEGQPEVRATLLDVVGRVYQALGLYDRALPLLTEALDLRESSDAPTLERAESRSNLGELLRLTGDAAGAEKQLRSAQALYREAIGEDDPTPGYARVLHRLGLTLYGRGDLDGAEPLFERALEWNRRLYGEPHDHVAENLQNLAAIRFARGDLASAEDLFRQALAMREAAPGRDHPQYAATLSNLAAVLGAKGDYAAAQEAYRSALDLQRRQLGDLHPRVASTLNGLAMILFAAGDPTAAESLHREAIAIRRQVLDPAHPELAQSLSNLGLVLQARGRLDEAEAVLRESLELRRRALPPGHPLIGHSLNNLAMTLQAQGELGEAEARFAEALGVLEPALGEHPDVASTINNLASCLDGAGRATEAEAAYRRALEMRRRILPARHPHLAYNLLGLGRLLVGDGRAREAEPMLREALEIREASMPAASAAIAEARSALDSCLRALGSPAAG